jgi:hypothetical protein
MADFTIPAANPPAPNSALQDEAVINADDPRLRQPVVQQGTMQSSPVPGVSRMTPEERAKRKAKLIQSFDRGVVHDRLSVPLPSDMHGEWCRNDPLEIDRLKTLGFEIDREHAVNRSLHDDGSGAAIVGDVIFMTCPREVKEIIDEIRQEKFIAMNGKPGDTRGKSKEEREFEANSLRDTGGVVPTMVESRTTLGISRSEVEAALNKVDQQTQPQAGPTT